MLFPAGIPVNFSTTFVDAVSARVAFSVYDDTGENPVLLLSPELMAQVRDDVYRGKFTPAAGKLYVVFMAVYTDGTFTTLDTAFPEQSLAVISQFLNPPVQDVVGIVDCEGSGE